MLYVSTLHARELVVSLWGRAWVSRRAKGVLIDCRGGLHDSLLWRTRSRHDSGEKITVQIEVATEETGEAKQAFLRGRGGTTHQLPERLAFGTPTLVTGVSLFYKGRTREPWKSCPLSVTR